MNKSDELIQILSETVNKLSSALEMQTKTILSLNNFIQEKSEKELGKIKEHKEHLELEIDNHQTTQPVPKK